MGRKKKKHVSKRETPVTTTKSRARSLRLEKFISNSDYLLAGIATLLFTGRLFCTDEVFIGSGTDMLSNEYPLHVFALSWMRQGILPLWNPFIFAGVPFQAGVHGYLYPGWWTGLLFSPEFDLKFGIFIHLLLASIGAVWLARLRVGHRLASLFAGLVYAFSGFFVMHLFAGHRVMVASAAYLPWILGALIRALRGDPRYLLLAAGLNGLMLLAGHYHIVYVGTFGLIIYLTLNQFFEEKQLSFRQRASQSGRGILYSAVAFLGGALIAAVQLIPMLSTLSLSQRAAKDLTFSASFSSSPINLLTYLFPHFFGNKVDVGFVGDWSYWESLGYLGIAPLVLLGSGFFLLGWRRYLGAAITAAFGLTLSLGIHTPLFEIYYAVVPGADLFRSPGRFCLLTTLFAALIAAESLDAWLSASTSAVQRKAAALAVWIVPIISGLALIVLFVKGSSEFAISIQSLADGKQTHAFGEANWNTLYHLALKDAVCAFILSSVLSLVMAIGFARPPLKRILAAIIAVVLAADLYMFGHRFLRTAPLRNFAFPARAAELIREAGEFGARMIVPPQSLWQDYGAIYGFGNPGGYDSFLDDRYARYINFSQGRDLDQFFVYERVRRGSPLIRHLGPKYMLSFGPPNKSSTSGLGGYPEFIPRKKINNLYFSIDPNATPRAFLVHEFKVVKDELSTLRTLADPAFNLINIALIEEPWPTSWSKPAPLPQGLKDEVRITRYEPNRVEISTRSATPSALVLSDAPDPGWTATVDGRETPILNANRVMRAVPLLQGEHVVAMTYLPQSLIWGSALSGCTLLVLSVMIWRALRKKKKPG